MICLVGLFPLTQSATRQYFLVQQTMTWADAQMFCRTNYTDLAIIGTAAELAMIQALAQSNMFTSEAWLGLDLDVNTWHWVDSGQPVGSTTFWDSGEPNNSDGHQECAVLTSSGWNDRACDELHRYVCYDSELYFTTLSLFIFNIDLLIQKSFHSQAHQK